MRLSLTGEASSLENYINRYQPLNPEISNWPLLEFYEVKEAFQKYLLYKIKRKKGEDPILVNVRNELESCSSVIPRERLNRLSYLVHATSSERELLCRLLETSVINSEAGSLSPKLFAIGFHQMANAFARWELASRLGSYEEMRLHFEKALEEHPLNKLKKESEKMERDLAKVPNSSPFKQYLLASHALDKKEKVRYVLHVLSRALEIDLDEREDLETCNDKVLNALYSRFLQVLAKCTVGKCNSDVKTSCEKINRTKKSLEHKIEATVQLLNRMTGVPGVQKLIDALCIKPEEKDCADFPGAELAWNPKIPLLEQRDENFNALCLSTLLEISHKRKINIDLSALNKALKRSDFTDLEDAARQMPKLHDHIRAKVIKLREDLGLHTPSAAATYDLFQSFKQALKERYAILKERADLNALQSLLLEEAYLNQNIPLLLKIESDFSLFITTPLPVIQSIVTTTSSSLATTTAETGSVASINKSSGQRTPKPEFIENIKDFGDWIAENKDSVFFHFVFQKGLLECIGDKSQLLEMARFTVELYVDLLRQEASMMKEPFPQVLSNLDELEALSTELAYKKFLKGLVFAKRKHGDSDILIELEQIGQRKISTQEKRALSIETLAPHQSEDHLEKLLHYLVALFHETSSSLSKDIKRGAFSSQKTKTAAFQWLGRSSFFKSLEVEIGTKNYPLIEVPMKIFTLKIKYLMDLLNVPPIYFNRLDSFIERGDIDGLNRIFYNVAYQRYIQAVNNRMEYLEETEVLQKLLQFDEELKDVSIVTRVEVNKQNVQTFVKDKELLNYLLFQLEQLCYDFRDLSDASKALIYEYLQKQDNSRPFDLYLQENRFSQLGDTEEPCDWFAYLYEQFIKKIAGEAQRSKYDTTRLLALELEKPDLFDLPKLDQLALCIRAPNPITVQELYKSGFVLSIERALRNNEVKSNHQHNFESIEDISIQVALLDHLSGSLEFSYLVHATINQGTNPRSLHVGYDFLKKVMKQPGISKNKGAIQAFFALHFVGYSQDKIDRILKKEEEEIQKLETFESLMQGELSGSPLKSLLESDGLIDSEGRCIGLFSLMPLRKLEPYIRTLKTFIELNLAFEKPSPYCRPDSWDQVLRSIHEMLEERLPDTDDLVSCFGKQVDTLIEKSLSEDIPGSFSDCLRAIGFYQMPRMGSDDYYQQYLFWQERAVQYFLNSSNLEKKKEALSHYFTNSRSDTTVLDLKNAVNSFIDTERSTYLVESLKTGIESGDWKAVNEVTDKLLYMEFKIRLVVLLGHYPSKIVDALQKSAAIDREEASYRRKIEASLNQLPELLLSEEHQEQLRSVLKNDHWIKQNTSFIEKKWTWVLGKNYLNNFPDIHVDPSSLSLYEKQAILDNICSELAESLLAEIRDLGMDEVYKDLIKMAYDRWCPVLWDWIVADVSYQKCLFKIQQARNDGEDMFMFDDLENSTKNCTIHEKLALVINTLEAHRENGGCTSILSGIESQGFFALNPYSLTAE